MSVFLIALNSKSDISRVSDDLTELQSSLGHIFSDVGILQEALTHASAKGSVKAARINERLEFLGDRVLGLIAAETLYAQYPDEDEGQLAPRLNAIVRKECCADVARQIDLEQYIDLTGAPKWTAGQVPTAVLGDACEAVIGALYLDGGLAAARAFFDAHWGRALDSVETLPRDAKSALQEYVQERKQDLPSYEVTGRKGPDHKPEFEVSVRIESGESARAKGPSRRRAEQAAAATLLAQLGVWDDEDLARAALTGSLT